MGRVAKRYAKALFLAADKDVLLVQKDLEALEQLMQESPEWSAFIQNPLYTQQQIQKILPTISKHMKLHAITQKFLTVLNAHGRITHLRLILKESIHFFNQERGQNFAEVRSVFPLDINLQGKISAYLSKQFKGDVHLKNIIDPKVLGGLSIQVNSNLFDATIRTQLNSIQRQLREA